MTPRRMTLCALCVLACLSLTARERPAADEAPAEHTYASDFEPYLTGYATYTFQDIKNAVANEAINGHPLRSVEDVFAWIKHTQESTHPGLFSRASLVYQSRSLQGASYETPRVIFFGSKNLVLAATGRADMLGGNRLELMEMPTSDGRFKMREIVFPDSPEDPAQNVVIDESPKSCAVCHGSDPKPIFDSYSRWPGVYGSNDDQVVLHANGANTLEYEKLKTFLDGAAKRGRYSVFNFDTYLDTDSFGEAILVSRYVPNGSLTDFLADANYRRLVRKIREASRPDMNLARLFLELAKAKGSASTDPADIPKLNPTKYLSRELVDSVGVDFNEVLASTVRETLRVSHEKRQRVLANAPVPAALLEEPALAIKPTGQSGFSFDTDDIFLWIVANMHYLANIAGLSIADWSLQLGVGSFAFSTNLHGAADMLMAFRDAFSGEASAPLPSPASLHPLYRSEDYRDDPVSRVRYSRREMDFQPVIVRCMSCHTNPYRYDNPYEIVDPAASTAAEYAFDDAATLRSQLIANQGALANAMRARIVDTRDPMPPAPHRQLNDSERAAFLEVLRVLTTGTVVAPH